MYNEKKRNRIYNQSVAGQDQIRTSGIKALQDAPPELLTEIFQYVVNQAKKAHAGNNVLEQRHALMAMVGFGECMTEAFRQQSERLKPPAEGDSLGDD